MQGFIGKFACTALPKEAVWTKYAQMFRYNHEITHGTRQEVFAAVDNDENVNRRQPNNRTRVVAGCGHDAARGTHGAKFFACGDIYAHLATLNPGRELSL
jgi:hypothetical protein